MATLNIQKLDDYYAERWRRFGEYIRARREALQDVSDKWTQTYVADTAQISRQIYNGIENGRPAKQKTLLKIAQVLELDPREVLEKAFAQKNQSSQSLPPLIVSVNTDLQDLPPDVQEAIATAIEAVAKKHRQKQGRHAKKLNDAHDPDASYNHADAPLDVANPRENKAYAGYDGLAPTLRDPKRTY